jgi:mono/diheme cytochrome c family protein
VTDKLDPRSFVIRTVMGLTAAILCLLALIGCTQTQNAVVPTTEVPASVESQMTGGATIYTQTCATSTCHGVDGQGIRSGSSFSAWPLAGSDFQSRHPNAEIVFDVVRSGDEPNLRALTDQQIYNSIAFELSQNQIRLKSPLTMANAYTTYGGSMRGAVKNGLFPPPSGISVSSTTPSIKLPLSTDNGRLRLQLDQLAEASAIGSAKPPPGGSFLIMVFVLTDLGPSPLTVSPDSLRLSTPSGGSLQTESTTLNSAIEQFHTQTITPQHGTAALVVFKLAAPDQFEDLVYADGAGNKLNLALKP